MFKGVKENKWGCYLILSCKIHDSSTTIEYKSNDYENIRYFIHRLWKYKIIYYVIFIIVEFLSNGCVKIMYVTWSCNIIKGVFENKILYFLNYNCCEVKLTTVK